MQCKGNPPHRADQINLATVCCCPIVKLLLVKIMTSVGGPFGNLMLERVEGMSLSRWAGWKSGYGSIRPSASLHSEEDALRPNHGPVAMRTVAVAH